jgi:hypothetical protein
MSVVVVLVQAAVQSISLAVLQVVVPQRFTRVQVVAVVAPRLAVF